MKSLIYISLLFASTSLFAQPVAREKIAFNSINSFGILTGSSGDNLALQTINGIRYKQWSAGIGTGIDWYGFKSVPVILDIRRNFSQAKHKPFLYANGGISFPWTGQNTEQTWNNSWTYKYDKNFCFEAGLGYSVNLKNKTALMISAGYSYKRHSFDQLSNNSIQPWPLPTSTKTSYEYQYRRLAIRLGLQF